MTASAPSRELERATAGLTWAWRRDDLGAYPPADGWALKYKFRSATTVFTVEATADGGGYLVSVPAATTNGYAAGSYSWLAYVERGADRFGTGTGIMVVDAVFDDSDPRTHARKVLDAIEAVLENRASQDQMNYSISVGGSSRSLGRTPLADLIALRSRYRTEVKAEEAALGRRAPGAALHQGRARLLLRSFGRRCVGQSHGRRLRLHVGGVVVRPHPWRTS